ncbi:MAG: ABC transporter substrate-binding protein [Thiovulaceae bacterium]|nr:ABC transporter substrate-binding protein [Sulfurimonadaceae bacterium]
MFKFFKKVLLLSIFLSSSLMASDAEIREVSTQFNKRADQIMEVVKNKSLSKKERNAQIVNIVDPIFDFMLMGKLSLGKNIWRSLSQEKKEAFTKLYVERMKNSYSKKVDSYTDEKIIIASVSQEKPNRITLITNLVGSDGNTEVIYKYYKPKQPIKGKDTWLVYDAVIVGVSIIKTDRSQFQEVLKSNTIDELMEKMQASKG